jgi:hypothetical protein
MSDRLLELRKEKVSLLERIHEIDKEIYDIGDASLKELEMQYGISRDDRDKKCKGCKEKCILPCDACYSGICEQCGYGYKNIVSILKVRYRTNELEELSKRCPYALLATK